MAHVNFQHVKQVLKQNNIKFKDDATTCNDCLKGKHRVPFSVSQSRARQIGELVHTDLCGPFEVESLGQSKYFLLLKDDYSNYRVVYFLKNKSEAKRKLKFS